MSDLPTQEQVLPWFDESWSRALCVAAHPDDLEYGLAAAVDRWVQQGKTVSYLLATHGEAGIDGIPPSEAASLRAQEERDGAAEVGVDVVETNSFGSFSVVLNEYQIPEKAHELSLVSAQIARSVASSCVPERSMATDTDRRECRTQGNPWRAHWKHALSLLW